MLIYLDSVIIIYAVEKLPLFEPRAQARIAALRTAGDRIAVSNRPRPEAVALRSPPKGGETRTGRPRWGRRR